MPQLGEERTAKELSKVGTYRYIWHACPDCGKERWVPILRGQPRDSRCPECSREETKRQTDNRYMIINLSQPKLGEVRYSITQCPSGRHFVRLIWDNCPECGKERWIKNNRKGTICWDCLMRKRKQTRSCNWKGGRTGDGHGYILIWLHSNDFFYPMANKAGYVLEHRLVVAKALGRNLHSWEIVHHKTGFARDDNRYPETLQLVSDLGHKQLTLLERRIHLLERRVLQLEAENIGLRQSAQ